MRREWVGSDAQLLIDDGTGFFLPTPSAWEMADDSANSVEPQVAALSGSLGVAAPEGLTLSSWLPWKTSSAAAQLSSSLHATPLVTTCGT